MKSVTAHLARFWQILLSVFVFAFTLGIGQTSAQQPVGNYAISTDLLPNLGRPLIRLERNRSCEACRWYAITIYDTDQVLWHGKDAVRRLGYDILPLRLPAGLSQAPNSKTAAETIVAMLRQHGFFDDLVADRITPNAANEELVEIFVDGGREQKTVKFYLANASEKLRWLANSIEEFYPFAVAKSLGPVVAADSSIFKIDTDLLEGKCALGRMVTLSDRGQMSEYFDLPEFRQKPAFSVDLDAQTAKEASRLIASLRMEKLPPIEQQPHRPQYLNTCVRDGSGNLACALNRDWETAKNARALAQTRELLRPFYSTLAAKRQAFEAGLAHRKC